MSKFRIYSQPGDYGRRTKLAILVEKADGIAGIVSPLTIKAVEPHALLEEYTLDGDIAGLDGRNLLQAMLDHAWEIGMRPGGVPEADTTKQVVALREHLADMRAIAFAGKVEPRA